MAPRKIWLLLAAIVILASGALWVRDSLGMLNADCHPWLKRCQVTDATTQQDPTQQK